MPNRSYSTDGRHLYHLNETTAHLSMAVYQAAEVVEVVEKRGGTPVPSSSTSGSKAPHGRDPKTGVPLKQDGTPNRRYSTDGRHLHHLNEATAHHHLHHLCQAAEVVEVVGKNWTAARLSNQTQIDQLSEMLKVH